MDRIYAVFLAGGRGTRLWPLSKEDCPKSIIRFGGNKTLLGDSINRIKNIVGIKNIRIVTDMRKAGLILNSIKNLSKENMIIEPFGRNTASAAGLAAINLEEDSIMALLPTDQVVIGVTRYIDTIKKSLEFVNRHHDVLLCVGTKPEAASTSFGYIKIGKIVEKDIFMVNRFIEKPGREAAGEFCKKRDYLFNAGIFIFKAKTILEAIKKYAPKLSGHLEIIKNNKKMLKAAFSKMEDVSIDYQIMEKAKNIYCIKGSFSWHDIGNWSRLDRLFKKDRRGNIIIGKTKLLGVYDSVIFNSSLRILGAIGLRNMIVAQTENGTLVCGREDAEKVKNLAKGMR